MLYQRLHLGAQLNDSEPQFISYIFVAHFFIFDNFMQAPALRIFQQRVKYFKSIFNKWEVTIHNNILRASLRATTVVCGA